MAKNIEMNYYNGSSYDVLYPKNTWANIDSKPTIPSTPVSIANGGTGATSREEALYNLYCKDAPFEDYSLTLADKQSISYGSYCLGFVFNKGNVVTTMIKNVMPLIVTENIQMALSTSKVLVANKIYGDMITIYCSWSNESVSFIQNSTTLFTMGNMNNSNNVGQIVFIRDAFSQMYVNGTKKIDPKYPLYAQATTTGVSTWSIRFSSVPN